MDEGRSVLFFVAPINRRTLRLKRIGETSPQRHNLRLPGAVNQRAWLRPPSHRDSDSPESSRCLALALACNGSAKQVHPGPALAFPRGASPCGPRTAQSRAPRLHRLQVFLPTSVPTVSPSPLSHNLKTVKLGTLLPRSSKLESSV